MVQKVLLEKKADAIMKTLANFQMHWICTLCKEKLENNKGETDDLVQQLENQTENLQISQCDEESILNGQDGHTEENGSNENSKSRPSVTVEIKETNMQTEEPLTTCTLVQTEEIETAHIHTQTIDEEISLPTSETQTQTIIEETTTTHTQTEYEQVETFNQGVQVQSEEKKMNTKETKNSSTQTEHLSEQSQAAFGEKEIEEQYRKQIEREVQVAFHLKMSKDKRKSTKVTSSKIEDKKVLELEKHKLEMERTKLELEKHDMFLEKSKTDEEKKGKTKSTLYSVLVAEIEKNSLKKYEEPKKEEFKRSRYPKSNLKTSRNETEKEVLYVRRKLEHMMDYGGDWRKTMDLLRILDRLDDVDLQILTSTKIMWTLDDLRRYNRHPEVTDFAKRIVKRWRRITPNDHRGGKYQDDYRTSRYREDKSPKRENSYRGYPKMTTKTKTSKTIK